MCDEETSLPQERLQVLRQAVHDQVNKGEVLGKIQSCIERTLQSKPADEAKVMKTLEDEGIIDDILSSLNLGLSRPPGRARSRGESSAHQQSTIPGPRARAPAPEPAPPVGGEGCWHLMVHVRGGRAFLEYLEPGEDGPSLALPGHPPRPPPTTALADTTLTLHLLYRDQRCASQPVPASCDPAIKETFLLALSNPAEKTTEEARSRRGRKDGPSCLSAPTTPASALQELLSDPAPVRLVLVSGRGEVGGGEVVGGAVVDWRRVLTSRDGRLALPVELSGCSAEEVGVVAGILDLQLELVPRSLAHQPLSPDLLATQLKVEQDFAGERERLFLAYAKAWWREYLQIRSSHAHRLVKIFAADERGRSWPVVVYVHPLRAPRLLESPRQAARWVGLLGHRCSPTPLGGAGGRGGEVWHHQHTFLAQRTGGCEDHAVLLCSLLLGFGLQAYVCVGSKARGHAHTWVMTLAHSGEVTFWESLTGQRFQHHSVDPDSCVGPVRVPTPTHPYRTVGCVFNHQSFLANIQPCDSLHSTRFNLSNPAHWKAMDPQAINAARGGGARILHPPLPLLGGSLDPVLLSVEVESGLRSSVVDHRRGLGLATVWSGRLSYILSPALAGYEMERLTGVAVGNEEFQQAVRLNVCEGHTFKAFPIQFVDVNTSRMFASCIKSDICHDIISCRGDQMEHALRCRVYCYPENVLAVWVMIAVQYQSVL